MSAPVDQKPRATRAPQPQVPPQAGQPELLSDIAVSIGGKAVEPETPAQPKGRKLNLVLCALAFVILFGYLFVAGEGDEVLKALERFNWWFLAAALVAILVYWLLESVCVQLFVNDLHPQRFSFFKTNVVTVIGQYFNCITPLSSGGQPMQAYYYQRFGLPLPAAMGALLCRFIVYQFTTTFYCALVLLLRFGEFTSQFRALTTLVVIGFAGGFVLMAMLLSLAFARKGTTRVALWAVDLLARLRIVKDPEASKAQIVAQLEDSYRGINMVLRRPKLLAKVAGVTFVQLTVFFSVSYIIYLGFGLEGGDYFTIISCQAFIYMISSFVPLPGAVGAAEGSYIAFFSYVYPDAGLVALSTFIWRMFTFYLPIVVGMVVTLAVNNPKTALAKACAPDAAPADRAPDAAS